MSGICSAGERGTGFISSVAGYIDCQAQTLGSGAWAALSAPGSTLMVVLTGFLTIFIALIGYNLMLGRSMTVRGATLAFVRIGAVLALATSWPAYRTLVYDLVVDAPNELVSEIGPQAGAIGSDGTLLQRLDMADSAIVRIASLRPGTRQAGPSAEVAPPAPPGFDDFALGGSRIIFLLTAIASLAAVRISAGLMLALGPFFIAFLLFDGTRSLFEGWIRVLAGAALASVGASLVLGLELALIAPWLSDVLARRMAGDPLPAMPTELFALASLFAILVLAALYGCARVAHAFRLPLVLRLEPAAASLATSRASAGEPVRGSPGARTSDGERTRAAAIADLVAASVRREQVRMLAAAPAASPAWTPPVRASGSNESGRTSVPPGGSLGRRPNGRVSARAARRDLGA